MPPRQPQLPTLLVTHGRDQRWEIELELADHWAKALRSGLKRAGASYWESIPVEFAFYGDVWRDDAERSDEVSPAQAAFATDLLGPSDERFPWDSVADVIRQIDARFKVGKVLLRHLMADLDAYFEDPAKRKAANDRLVQAASGISGDLVLLGHSMGSIVGYLTLLQGPAELRRTRSFLTFGSPMGMPSLHEVIGRHAEGTPFPSQPSRWVNVFNKEDFATVERYLAGLYGAGDARDVEDLEAKGRPPTVRDIGRGHDPMIYLSSMGLARSLRSLIETEVRGEVTIETSRVLKKRAAPRGAADERGGDEPQDERAERSLRTPRALPPMDVDVGGPGLSAERAPTEVPSPNGGSRPAPKRAARQSARGAVAKNGGGRHRAAPRPIAKNGGRRKAPRPARRAARRVACNGGGGHAPSRPAAEPPPATRRVSRTASADFPPVVAPDSERELLFAIGPRAVFARSTTIEADVPVEIDTLELRVGVHAPDFTTRTPSGEDQSWADLTLDLNNPEERQDLRFRLRAKSTTRTIDSTITVTVYKRGLPLGSVELATRIDPKYRSASGSFALSFAAAPEPDFTLIIADRSRDVIGRGPFDLRIGREQAYVDRALGEFRVTGNAWGEARKILERFRAIKKLQTRTERIEAAQTIGVNLWWRLPEAFHRTYWEEMHGRDNLSIAIYSQEPYIPWELVVPQRKRGSVRVEKMLGVAFSMARWTSGREFPRSPAGERVLRRRSRIRHRRASDGPAGGR